MKVKDLLEEIEQCRKDYPDIDEWSIYTEQIDESDKIIKVGTGFGGNWKHIKDSEEREYFDCSGFWTKFIKEKIFTINVNY